MSTKIIALFFLFLLNFAFVLSLVDIHLHPSKITDKSSRLISLDTRLGTLVGYKKEVQNKTINVFYGVPYAEPPVGKKRFRRTKLIKKFPQDPYLALDFKAHCPQKYRGIYHLNDTFSEDCLYLNINVPDIENLKKVNGKCVERQPVMLYFYGGVSSANTISVFDKMQVPTYSGDLFASLHNTILVTINRRHGLFSTLYVEHEFYANLGLFDENLGIQWIKEYIDEFCGDGERLTLFGNSYGSIEIGIHLISKYSKNMIQNAIMQSGSPFFRVSNIFVSKKHYYL